MSSDPATDPPPLDPAAVRDLLDLLGGDRAALGEVVAAFLEEAPLRVEELRSGLGAGDAELIGRAAHTLKSNAATFGARALEAQSRALEETARGGDISASAPLVDAVAASWHEARPALAALREDGTPP